jgi:hypothetical protein
MPLSNAVSEGDLQSFRENGYLSIPHLTTAEDIRSIRKALDAVFARFDTLPARIRFDLSDRGHTGVPQIAEVHYLADLRPELKDSLFFQRALSISRQILGRRAAYLFDHAMYKPTGPSKATPWHQDAAYMPHRSFSFRRIAWWLPLQDATVESGCMQFLPGSHRGPLLPHIRAENGHTLLCEPDGTGTVAAPIGVGGATLHAPMTLHYTGPNTSQEMRRAWIVHFGVRELIWRKVG